VYAPSPIFLYEHYHDGQEDALYLVQQRMHFQALLVDTMTTLPYKSNPLYPTYMTKHVALLTGSYSLDRWCAIRGRWDVIGAANTGMSIIFVLVWVKDEGELTLWAERNNWLMDVLKTESLPEEGPLASAQKIVF
jgi:hypothetical protein